MSEFIKIKIPAAYKIPKDVAIVGLRSYKGTINAKLLEYDDLSDVYEIECEDGRGDEVSHKITSSAGERTNGAA